MTSCYSFLSKNSALIILSFFYMMYVIINLIIMANSLIKVPGKTFRIGTIVMAIILVVVFVIVITISSSKNEEVDLPNIEQKQEEPDGINLEEKPDIGANDQEYKLRYKGNEFVVYLPKGLKLTSKDLEDGSYAYSEQKQGGSYSISILGESPKLGENCKEVSNNIFKSQKEKRYLKATHTNGAIACIYEGYDSNGRLIQDFIIEESGVGYRYSRTYGSTESTKAMPSGYINVLGDSGIIIFADGFETGNVENWSD